jgi:hypothetical protein
MACSTLMRKPLYREYPARGKAQLAASRTSTVYHDANCSGGNSPLLHLYCFQGMHYHYRMSVFVSALKPTTLNLHFRDALAVSLQRDEVLSFESGANAEIACVSGTVWVTFENDSFDHVLRTKEALILKRRGQAVVCAMTDALVRLKSSS